MYIGTVSQREGYTMLDVKNTGFLLENQEIEIDLEVFDRTLI